MKRDILIVTPLLFFLLGVGGASLTVFFTLMPLLVFLAALFWMISLWRDLIQADAKKIILLLILSVLAIYLGWGRFALEEMFFPLRVDNLTSGQNVTVLGRVDSLPERNGQKVDFLLRLLALESAQFSGSEGKVLLVRLPYAEKVVYGERLLLRGRLVSTADSTLMEFLRQKLYRLKAVGFLDGAALLQRLDKENREPWSSIFVWRAQLLSYFSAVLGEPAASLVNGVLIGERGSIPAALAKSFQVTGLTHILAISGFNITIIINLLIVCTVWLPRRWRLLPTVVVIAIFVILTGASASVVRAAVMGMLVFAVKNLGRRVSPFKAIVLSVFLIVLVEPRLLGLDISFQLSVLATLSLVFFANMLQWEAGTSWVRLLWDGLATTLAAQVISLPYIFYHFGTISLISPVANLLIGPLIPLLMLAGVLVWVAAALPGPLVWLMAGLTQLLVLGMTTIIEALAGLPLAQIEFGQGMLWLVLCYYLLLFRVFRKYRPGPGFP